jgi:hypothetical protein
VKLKARCVRQRRAEELGAVELAALLEWTRRNRPRALRYARSVYGDLCTKLYKLLARDGSRA